MVEQIHSTTHVHDSAVEYLWQSACLAQYIYCGTEDANAAIKDGYYPYKDFCEDVGSGTTVYTPSAQRNLLKLVFVLRNKTIAGVLSRYRLIQRVALSMMGA